uniref:Uncharacterized protein n=1 Tax=Erpetoichthys calabaricus TaxID=27687 RepID=A0A8C4RFJ7_ERPCA
MLAEESLQYDSLKGAILEKFTISTETYRICFRSVEWGENQSPKELLAQLRPLLQVARTKKHTVEQVIDFIVEQLLQTIREAADEAVIVGKLLYVTSVIKEDI